MQIGSFSAGIVSHKSPRLIATTVSVSLLSTFERQVLIGAAFTHRWSLLLCSDCWDCKNAPVSSKVISPELFEVCFSFSFIVTLFS